MEGLLKDAYSMVLNADMLGEIDRTYTRRAWLCLGSSNSADTR